MNKPMTHTKKTTFQDHLAPTEEAGLLYDSAAGFVAASKESLVGRKAAFDGAQWASIAELGWHGALVDEAHGGLGLPLKLVAVLARICGEALVTVPFVQSSIMSVAALTRAPRSARADALLSGIADGSRIVALVAECDSLPNNAGFAVVADEMRGVLRLDGKIAVAEVSQATTDVLLGLEMPGGEKALICIPADRAGVEIMPYSAVDGRPLAVLRLTGVEVTPDEIVCEGPDAEDALDHAGFVGTAAMCNEMVGALDEINRLTVGYLKERKQFGQALAEFQVLRHRTADMHIDTEIVRSVAELSAFAAGNLDDPHPHILRARVVAADYGRRIGEAAIQLHGGMGMTDEMAVGHYYKRVLYIRAALGGAWRALDVLETDMEDACQ